VPPVRPASAREPLRSYYAARAREYDRIYEKPERQPDLRAIEEWLPPRFAAKRVLEIACGTGYWTRFIARSAKQVAALDAAQETVDVAQMRLPPGAVEFVIGDAYALPAFAVKFEAAFAGFWFSHVPVARRTEFLRGLNDALAPGANVVLLDNLYVEGSSSPISERDAEGNTYQTRRLGDGSRHRVMKNFPSEAQLRDAVAGFARDARFTRWEYYWAFEYVLTD
jgi:demethylmenaquinone methyltransferase/2-methoxy-6-polyprenyl-1,4-benzoquinol methylase